MYNLHTAGPELRIPTSLERVPYYNVSLHIPVKSTLRSQTLAPPPRSAPQSSATLQPPRGTHVINYAFISFVYFLLELTLVTTGHLVPIPTFERLRRRPLCRVDLSIVHHHRIARSMMHSSLKCSLATDESKSSLNDQSPALRTLAARLMVKLSLPRSNRTRIIIAVKVNSQLGSVHDHYLLSLESF